MTTVTREPMSVGDLAARYWHRDRILFQDRTTRDRVFAHLKAKGQLVRKISVRGQRLHPEYVADFVGTYETGFGNTDYQTHWKVLYGIVVS